ncbi:hypothetical protein [Hymenobacter sp. UYCo722]|uniref:hypothetical protein n=1 Tax=Hymenobacter sp. UYCo722 TaxID=3156335 RepID=UPI003392B638
MIAAFRYCPLLIAGLLWLGPVVACAQGSHTGQPAADSAGATPRRLKMSPASKVVVAASVQQLIAKAPTNPLNRQHPPANPVVVLPAQNKAKLLRKIKTALTANGYALDAYRPDSLSCRVSKATDGMSKDRYLLWLEPATSLAVESAAIKVFVQYGSFMHFWGTPADQESPALTGVGEYDKKVRQLKSVLDTMPR